MSLLEADDARVCSWPHTTHDVCILPQADVNDYQAVGPIAPGETVGILTWFLNKV